MYKLLVLPALLVLGLTACQTAMKASNPQGLEKFGYPYVLKTINFQPGHALTVTVADTYAKGMAPGHATYTIPANAFTMPVTFQILAGTNTYWDGMVKSNEKVVANFAYLVTDPATGQIVTKFNAPITYSVTDSMITKDSIYWATTAASPPRLIDANKASKITGTMLEHATPLSAVGWIITTPKSEISMAAPAKSTSMSGGY